MIMAQIIATIWVSSSAIVNLCKVAIYEIEKQNTFLNNMLSIAINIALTMLLLAFIWGWWGF